ncbi:MAG: HEAT repeat domain-containing protein, partial [Armatimonadota bacterium]|nr:HEAT repeat domain-containing protein [Armatimonadota bacterium]MDW8144527.1 HEAT repeat domain-containing protein [Armatimonadota bacterium]
MTVVLTEPAFVTARCGSDARVEQKKVSGKRLWIAWNWWTLFLLLMSALSIAGYAAHDEDASGILWIVVVLLVSVVALLCGLCSPRTPELVERLGDLNPLIQQKAFERILKMPREQAISYFVQALETPFPVLTLLSAHKLAVEGLALLKAKEAIPVLCEALKHPSATVRARAIWALGEIGDPSAIPHLIPLLGEGDAHSPLFKSQNQMISEQAAEALQKLGESELVVAFKNALKGKLDENS